MSINCRFSLVQVSTFKVTPFIVTVVCFERKLNLDNVTQIMKLYNHVHFFYMNYNMVVLETTNLGKLSNFNFHNNPNRHW